jgi:hypothetical protein
MGRHQPGVDPLDRKGGMTMNLLHSYLNAVRVFLPRTVDQQDILSELSAHLQIKFEEREEQLGRPLTEDEQAAVLSDYGSPVVVAARYGGANLGLAFGRQLIGPEVFVLYRYVLLAQFTITIIVVTAFRIASGASGGLVGRYLLPMLMQSVLTTTIFIAIDAFKRRSRTRTAWNFPPAYMQLVPRWQSLAGFVTLSVCALWWALLPYAPFLMLGPAAARVEFTPAWHAFYWPFLVPLLVGATQRLVTFAAPGSTLLQSVTRLLTNGWGVAMVYPFMLATPYVTPIAGANAEQLAARINTALWWNAPATFGLYWLINAGFMAALCIQHAARLVRARRDRSMVLNP